ncbi:MULTISPECIES: hypothetical protein [unclassified Actinoplanes]|uniref:hypothetical protein n=1 Tax=unclassified Actinoplanes TaxID=2626549 RepID=UPI0005B84845|nr:MULTISPECIES: hypothetical protein [unclassified Actinoplanes]
MGTSTPVQPLADLPDGEPPVVRRHLVVLPRGRRPAGPAPEAALRHLIAIPRERPDTPPAVDRRTVPIDGGVRTRPADLSVSSLTGSGLTGSGAAASGVAGSGVVAPRLPVGDSGVSRLAVSELTGASGPVRSKRWSVVAVVVSVGMLVLFCAGVAAVTVRLSVLLVALRSD